MAILNQHKIYFQMMYYFPYLKILTFSNFEGQRNLRRAEKRVYPHFEEVHRTYIFLHLLSHNISVEKTNGFLNGYGNVKIYKVFLYTFISEAVAYLCFARKLFSINFQKLQENTCGGVSFKK